MKRKFYVVFSVAVAALVLCFSLVSAWGAGSGALFVEDELLVQTRVGVSNAAAAAAAKVAGATLSGEIEPLRIKHLKVPAQARESVMAALARNPNFTFVENNYFASGSLVPNDDRYSSQWHLPAINAAAGWEISTGSADVAIAIIDSGIDPGHPDLADKLIPGYNFLENNQVTNDVLGHGTAVAGCAAAQSDNLIGVAGVSWNSQLMPLVVLNSENWATYYDIARAIIYAVDHGVKVMNISIGGTSSSSTLQNAVDYAWERGAVIFSSAGNSATSTPNYPAACGNVVAVTATTSSDLPASFTTFGNWVDVAAPGSYILTTNRGGGYGSWNGTSFSSPITCGLASLVMSVNPALTNAQVVELIKAEADDLGAAGFDPYFGYGRINVSRTLTAALAADPVADLTSPEVSISSPADAVEISGLVEVLVNASDDGGVAQVELYIDSVLFAVREDFPYNFNWDTELENDGSFELLVSAIDGSGNIGWSEPVTVVVANVVEPPTSEPDPEPTPEPIDSTPPQVSFTSPGDGTTVVRNVKVTAVASDNVAVSCIEVYLDGVFQIAVFDKEAASWSWNTRKTASGSHEIKVLAFDPAGNVASDTIIVYN